MTNDFVTRLRDLADEYDVVGIGVDFYFAEAANEIERLRAVLQEVDRLCDYNGACDEIRTIVRAALTWEKTNDAAP
jgi:hypothetical protein